jgi:hypothetical protein
MAIEKGTDRFVDIAVELVTAGFELDVETFSLGNQGF